MRSNIHGFCTISKYRVPLVRSEIARRNSPLVIKLSTRGEILTDSEEVLGCACVCVLTCKRAHVCGSTGGERKH